MKFRHLGEYKLYSKVYFLGRINASSSISSSSSKISKRGSLKELVVIIRSKDNNKEGSKRRLAVIANKSVTETNNPRATVPPNSEAINIEKPKNKTIEV